MYSKTRSRAPPSAQSTNPPAAHTPPPPEQSFLPQEENRSRFQNQKPQTGSSPSAVRPIRHLRLPPRANLPHRVNPPPLALEISARQNFTQQTRAKQNHARLLQWRGEH